VVLDAGTSLERKAPIVVKLELSVPVGADMIDVHTLMHNAATPLSIDDADAASLFANGIMPGA